MGDCSGSGRTVAPPNANRWKPACWNVRVATPTFAPGTPSISSHEDTDRNAEGRFTISGIGSIGDFNGLIGKKGCAALEMLDSK